MTPLWAFLAGMAVMLVLVVFALGVFLVWGRGKVSDADRRAEEDAKMAAESLS